MRRTFAALIAAAALLATDSAPGVAGHRRHLSRPNAATLLAAAPISPNGIFLHEGERMRTLELDELAPLRMRLSIPF